MNARLFPLGEAVGGHAFLGMDERGRIFLVGHQVRLLGNDIYEGLENLLVGRRPGKD
jgi:hypothetical protein